MDEFMRAALEEARKGLSEGGIPIGSVLAILNDPECIQLMRDFIARNPQLWNEDIGE